MLRRLRTAAGRSLSDLRTVLVFARQHRGTSAAARERLAELVRDKHVLVATRLPGSTDGPPYAVTVVQPGGAITSVHAGWFGAAAPDEREVRLQAHAEAVRAAMEALGVGLPAVRLVARALLLLATAGAGVAACADLVRGLGQAGWRAALLRLAWPFLLPLLPALLGPVIRLTARLWLRRQLARPDGRAGTAGPRGASILG